MADENISNETTKKHSVRKFLLPLLAFLGAGVSFSYFNGFSSKPSCDCVFPNTQVSQEENHQKNALQKTQAWLLPLWENKKFKLQECPKELQEIKELLEILSYRIDSYFDDPQANKAKILQDIQDAVEKGISKESQHAVDSYLKQMNLEQSTEEDLKKYSISAYACIAYKKTIPILKEFLKKK
ncbi:MAG: hypothetical protein HUU50_07355 [Candidatus Brocadiae bacterium]|nr:hypothetical protein [Candidatus Brocadiia bacterium]